MPTKLKTSHSINSGTVSIEWTVSSKRVAATMAALGLESRPHTLESVSGPSYALGPFAKVYVHVYVMLSFRSLVTSQPPTYSCSVISDDSVRQSLPAPRAGHVPSDCLCVQFVHQTVRSQCQQPTKNDEWRAGSEKQLTNSCGDCHHDLAYRLFQTDIS